jgi:integrase
MIGAGWTPKRVQTTLGHASIAFSLTVYGHLFDDDADEAAEALDQLSRPTSAVQAPYKRSWYE